MTKATYKRKHLISLLTVSESESLTVMVGSMTAGRQAGRQAWHSIEAVAESLHIIH